MVGSGFKKVTPHILRPLPMIVSQRLNNLNRNANSFGVIKAPFRNSSQWLSGMLECDQNGS